MLRVKYTRSVVLLIFALFICCFQSFGVMTRIFYEGRVLSVDHPDVEIRNIYGLRLRPIDVKVRTKERTALISHSVENLSNTTTKIGIVIKKVTDGWSAELIHDSNGDGKRQLTENQKIQAPMTVSEGASLHFLVDVERPTNSKKGDKGEIIIAVTSFNKDGIGYVGDNGIIYGGNDEIDTVDVIIVE